MSFPHLLHHIISKGSNFRMCTGSRLTPVSSVLTAIVLSQLLQWPHTRPLYFHRGPHSSVFTMQQSEDSKGFRKLVSYLYSRKASGPHIQRKNQTLAPAHRPHWSFPSLPLHGSVLVSILRISLSSEHSDLFTIPQNQQMPS